MQHYILRVSRAFILIDQISFYTSESIWLDNLVLETIRPTTLELASKRIMSFPKSDRSRQDQAQLPANAGYLKARHQLFPDEDLSKSEGIFGMA